MEFSKSDEIGRRPKSIKKKHTHSGLVHVREKEENYNRVQIKSKSGIRTAKKKQGGINY